MKIYVKGNYLFIDNSVQLFEGLAKNILVTRYSGTIESFYFRNVNGFSDAKEVLLTDIQKEDGSAYTLTEFITFYTTELGKSSALTSTGVETLKHFIYNPVTDKLEADRAIETTLNSLFLGEQHKMSSGAENIFFTNLGNETNFYPMWGGLKDQSLTVNQGSDGFIPPSGRVYSDMFSLPLGGNVTLNNTGYSGPNYFGVNIAGLGITTTAGEDVEVGVSLVYFLSINDRKVYKQVLPTTEKIFAGDLIEWFFDHPVEIHAGTTIFAEIRKIDRNTDQDFGVFQVRQGDELQADGNYRYQAIVHNRLFEDKDLELISPYLKYKSMDFGLDSTGSTILLRDLTLGSSSLLVPHAVNTLEATANGTEITIKVKGGAKVIVESLPVNAVSVDGSLVNSVLNQAVVQLNSIFTNTAGFASGGGNDVTNFVLSGNDLTITLADATSFTVDVTTLGVDENKFVNSGAISGSNLELTMNDSSIVTIDMSNMINGSSLTATNDKWFISYGTNANIEVGVSTNDSTVNQQLPFYFGQALTQGSQFNWNFQSNGGSNLILGIWDGAEVATPYNGGSITASNWGTMFLYAGGFIAGSNSTLTNTTNGTKYVVTNGDALSMRFDDLGFLTLVDISVSPEVEIAKTTIALGVSSFNLQMHTWANGVLPNGIISEKGWSIAHDFDNSEDGIINGIEDHTVIKSEISIEIGEKIMFMLDEVGQGDYFGTNYTAASSGVSTAEEQLDNTFIYQTNEAIVFDTSAGVSDWNANTIAPNYFYAASLNQYRDGGAGTIQGMFSLRFTDDGKLTLFDEDSNIKIATAKSDPAPGSSVNLYFGVKGARAYYSIPVISKQTINAGSQPDVNFVPTVANQTATVTEGDILNFQIFTSGNLVNQIVEVDAPSWMSMNQLTGVLSGTAPAYVGTSADTIVVNCKAGNAIGGTVNFTVTVTVSEIAYTNSKSLKFSNNSTAYLNGNHALVTSLQRTGNGSGSSDAWSISIWVKPSTITNSQTIFYYGGDDLANEGRIDLTQFSGGNLLFRYGNNANNLSYIGVGNFLTNQWNHVLVTYSGADTLIANGGATAFSMFINGVNGTSQLQQAGGGFSSNIPADKYRIGRLLGSTTSQYLSDGIINQVAIFNTDESANIATIYNSGNTQDLSLLASAPVHYYEMETSVTTIPDIIGSADLTGFNFSTSDLVTDTP